ncbi:hypothetical protein PtA15_14A23 [Puccinia triticina]|uniref:Uncharacterized protein n=1 Tax=Puccinia triticina TaxID=208348 RepID=A0ABY7D1Z7_9BASI|nr:uncharacterized protein PtA15_14A23 [Puccinia triticina]WAQ91143.1 hypothetical protein PtA15_14A23 [Puccinia triticina]
MRWSHAKPIAKYLCSFLKEFTKRTTHPPKTTGVAEQDPRILLVVLPPELNLNQPPSRPRLTTPTALPLSGPAVLSSDLRQTHSSTSSGSFSLSSLSSDLKRPLTLLLSTFSPITALEPDLPGTTTNASF